MKGIETVDLAAALQSDPQAALSRIVVDWRHKTGIQPAGRDGNKHDRGSAIDCRNTAGREPPHP